METRICEDARCIYADLLQQIPATSTEEASDEPFKASRGSFKNFKKSTDIHSVATHCEAASSDIKAAEDYLKIFARIIATEGYISQQVFNSDETGLFGRCQEDLCNGNGEEDARPQVHEGKAIVRQ